MNDRPRYVDSTSDDRGLPTWLKVSALVAAIAILLIVAVLFMGGVHVPRPH